MKTSQRIKTIKAILFYHLFKIKTPVYVGFEITERCNKYCIYCKAGKSKKELTTQQILTILKELKKVGATMIGFTGGEALLRKDIGKIIRYSSKQGLYTLIKTNGRLVPDRIKDLKYADKIKLSLDGPEKIHDSMRGKNSFKQVIKAAELCKKYKIPVGFNTTVSKANMNHANQVLKIAKRFNAKVDFAPLIQVTGREKVINRLMPSQKEFRDFFISLIHNRKFRKHIANSKRNLKYLSKYPKTGKINCFAGKLFCRISSDGYIFPCPLVGKKHPSLNIVKYEFKKAFSSLPNAGCKGCWCDSVLEFNLICDLKIESLIKSTAAI